MSKNLQLEDSIPVSQLLKELGFISSLQMKQVISLLSNSSHFQHVDFQIDFFGIKIDGHTSNLIDRHLYFLGAYELSILQEIQKILSSKKDSIFIDVGSNIGLHSCFASRFAGHVYSFEPYHLVRERSLEIIKKNNISNITIFPYGLGKLDELLSFVNPPHSNSGLGTFLNTPDFENTLQVKNGDSFLKEKSINNVDLIKIDTEGFETFVLEGLWQTIDRCRPSLIVEYSEKTHQYLAKNEKLMDFIKKNYHTFIFPYPNSPDSPQLPWNYDFFGNILFKPKV